MSTGKLFLIAATILLCFGLAKECADDAVRELEYERTHLVDTLVYVDTVRYYMPVAKDSAVVRYVTMRLPVALKGELSPGDKPAGAGGLADGPLAEARGLDKKAEAGAEAVGPGMPGDSVEVEVPLITRHYADSSYEAWVSGPIDPRLDSINVYARMEVVTIKEPPERTGRWGVGMFAGYGITAHGVQPCAGISINYNFWNF